MALNKKYKAALSGSAATLALLAGMDSAEAQRAFAWQGFYVGAHGDYGWSHSKNSDAGTWGGHGWGGGIQAGYNHTLSWLVLGGEVDASLSGIDGTSDPFFGGKTLKNKMEWSGSLRGRVGVPVNGVPVVDSILFYGTGGIAIGRWKTTFNDLSSSEHKGKTYYGWTAGGGMEVALGRNISVRAEFLHTDYGSEKVDIGGSIFKIDNRTDMVRLGLNWRFTKP